MFDEIFTNTDSLDVKCQKLRLFVEDDKFSEVISDPQDFLKDFIPFTIEVLTKRRWDQDILLVNTTDRYFILSTLNKFTLDNTINVKLFDALNYCLERDNVRNVSLTFKTFSSFINSTCISEQKVELHLQFLMKFIEKGFRILQRNDEVNAKVFFECLIRLFDYITHVYYKRVFCRVFIESIIYNCINLYRTYLSNEQVLDMIRQNKNTCLQIISSLNRLLKNILETNLYSTKNEHVSNIILETSMFSIFYCPEDAYSLRTKLIYHIFGIVTKNKELFLVKLEEFFDKRIFFTQNDNLSNVKSLVGLTHLISLFGSRLPKSSFNELYDRTKYMIDLWISVIYTKIENIEQKDLEYCNIVEDIRDSIYEKSLIFYMTSLNEIVDCSIHQIISIQLFQMRFEEHSDYISRYFEILVKIALLANDAIERINHIKVKQICKSAFILLSRAFREIYTQFTVFLENIGGCIFFNNIKPDTFYKLFSVSLKLLDNIEINDSELQYVTEYFCIFMISLNFSGKNISEMFVYDILIFAFKKKCFIEIIRLLLCDSVNVYVEAVFNLLRFDLEGDIDKLAFKNKDKLGTNDKDITNEYTINNTKDNIYTDNNYKEYIINSSKEYTLYTKYQRNRKQDNFLFYELYFRTLSNYFCENYEFSSLKDFEYFMDCINFLISKEEIEMHKIVQECMTSLCKISEKVSEYFFERLEFYIDTFYNLYILSEQDIYLFLIFSIPVLYQRSNINICVLGHPIIKAIQKGSLIGLKALTTLLCIVDNSRYEKLTEKEEVLFYELVETLKNYISDSSLGVPCSQVLANLKWYHRSYTYTKLPYKDHSFYASGIYIEYSENVIFDDLLTHGPYNRDFNKETNRWKNSNNNNHTLLDNNNTISNISSSNTNNHRFNTTKEDLMIKNYFFRRNADLYDNTPCCLHNNISNLNNRNTRSKFKILVNDVILEVIQYFRGKFKYNETNRIRNDFSISRFKLTEKTNFKNEKEIKSYFSILTNFVYNVMGFDIYESYNMEGLVDKEKKRVASITGYVSLSINDTDIDLYISEVTGTSYMEQVMRSQYLYDCILALLECDKTCVQNIAFEFCKTLSLCSVNYWFLKIVRAKLRRRQIYFNYLIFVRAIMEGLGKIDSEMPVKVFHAFLDNFVDCARSESNFLKLHILEFLISEFTDYCSSNILKKRLAGGNGILALLLWNKLPNQWAIDNIRSLLAGIRFTLDNTIEDNLRFHRAIENILNLIRNDNKNIHLQVGLFFIYELKVGVPFRLNFAKKYLRIFFHQKSISFCTSFYSQIMFEWLIELSESNITKELLHKIDVFVYLVSNFPSLFIEKDFCNLTRIFYFKLNVLKDEGLRCLYHPINNNNTFNRTFINESIYFQSDIKDLRTSYEQFQNIKEYDQQEMINRKSTINKNLNNEKNKNKVYYETNILILYSESFIEYENKILEDKDMIHKLYYDVYIKNNTFNNNNMTCICMEYYNIVVSYYYLIYSNDTIKNDVIWNIFCNLPQGLMTPIKKIIQSGYCSTKSLFYILDKILEDSGIQHRVNTSIYSISKHIQNNDTISEINQAGNTLNFKGNTLRILKQLISLYFVLDKEDDRVLEYIYNIFQECKLIYKNNIKENKEDCILVKVFEFSLMYPKQDTIFEEILLGIYPLLYNFYKGYILSMENRLVWYIKKHKGLVYRLIVDNVSEECILYLVELMYKNKGSFVEYISNILDNSNNINANTIFSQGFMNYIYPTLIPEQDTFSNLLRNIDLIDPKGRQRALNILSFFTLIKYPVNDLHIKIALTIFNNIRNESEKLIKYIEYSINYFKPEHYEYLFNIDYRFILYNKIQVKSFNGIQNTAILKGLLKSLCHKDMAYDTLVQIFGDHSWMLVECFVEYGYHSTSLIEYCKKNIIVSNYKSLILYYLSIHSPEVEYFNMLLDLSIEEGLYTLISLKNVVNYFKESEDSLLSFRNIILEIIKEESNTRFHILITYPLVCNIPVLIDNRILRELCFIIRRLFKTQSLQLHILASEILNVCWDKLIDNIVDKNIKIDKNLCNLYINNCIRSKINMVSFIWEEIPYEIKIDNEISNINVHNTILLLEKEIRSNKSEEYKISLCTKLINGILTRWYKYPVSYELITYLERYIDTDLYLQYDCTTFYNLIRYFYKTNKFSLISLKVVDYYSKELDNYSSIKNYKLLEIINMLLEKPIQNNILVQFIMNILRKYNNRLFDISYCIRIIFIECDLSFKNSILFYRLVFNKINEEYDIFDKGLFYELVLSFIDKYKEIVMDDMDKGIDRDNIKDMDNYTITNKEKDTINNHTITNKVRDISIKKDTINIYKEKNTIFTKDKDTVNNNNQYTNNNNFTNYTKRNNKLINLMGDISDIFYSGLVYKDTSIRNKYFQLFSTLLPRNIELRLSTLLSLDMSYLKEECIPFILCRLLLDSLDDFRLVTFKAFVIGLYNKCEMTVARCDYKDKIFMSSDTVDSSHENFSDKVKKFVLSDFRIILYDLMYYNQNVSIHILSALMREIQLVNHKENCIMMSQILKNINNKQILSVCFLEYVLREDVPFDILIKFRNGPEAWHLLNDKLFYKDMMNSDMHYGVLRITSKFPEISYASLHMQFGMTWEALEIYGSIQEKGLKGELSYYEDEYNIVLEEWYKCAKELQQWHVFDDESYELFYIDRIFYTSNFNFEREREKLYSALNSIKFRLGIRDKIGSSLNGNINSFNNFNTINTNNNYNINTNITNKILYLRIQLYELFLSLFTDVDFSNAKTLVNQINELLVNGPNTKEYNEYLLILIQIVFEILDIFILYNPSMSNQYTINSLGNVWNNKEPCVESMYEGISLFSAWRIHAYRKIEDTFTYINPINLLNKNHNPINTLEYDISTILNRNNEQTRLIKNTKRALSYYANTRLGSINNYMGISAYKRGHYDLCLYLCKSNISQQISHSDSYYKMILEILCYYNLGMYKEVSQFICKKEEYKGSVCRIQGIMEEKFNMKEAKRKYLNSSLLSQYGENYYRYSQVLSNESGLGGNIPNTINSTNNDELLCTCLMGLKYADLDISRDLVLLMLVSMETKVFTLQEDKFKILLEYSNVNAYVIFIPKIVSLLKGPNYKYIILILKKILKVYKQPVSIQLNILRHECYINKDSTYTKVLDLYKEDKDISHISKLVEKFIIQSETSAFNNEYYLLVIIEDLIQDIISFPYSDIKIRKKVQALFESRSLSCQKENFLVFAEILKEGFLCPHALLDILIDISKNINLLLYGIREDKNLCCNIYNEIVYGSYTKIFPFGIFNDIRNDYRNVISIERFNITQISSKAHDVMEEISFWGSDGKAYKFDYYRSTYGRVLRINEGCLQIKSDISGGGDIDGNCTIGMEGIINNGISDNTTSTINTTIDDGIIEYDDGLGNINKEEIREYKRLLNDTSRINLSIPHAYIKYKLEKTFPLKSRDVHMGIFKNEALYLGRHVNLVEYSYCKMEFIYYLDLIKENKKHPYVQYMDLIQEDHIHIEEENDISDVFYGIQDSNAKYVLSLNNSKDISNVSSVLSNYIYKDNMEIILENRYKICNKKPVLHDKLKTKVFLEVMESIHPYILKEYIKRNQGNAYRYFLYKSSFVSSYSMNMVLNYVLCTMDIRPEHVVVDEKSGMYINRKVFDQKYMNVIYDKDIRMYISPNIQEFFGNEVLEGRVLSILYHSCDQLKVSWFNDLMKMFNIESRNEMVQRQVKEFSVVKIVNEWTDIKNISKVKISELAWI